MLNDTTKLDPTNDWLFFFYHNKSLITETVQEHFPIDGSL